MAVQRHSFPVVRQRLLPQILDEWPWGDGLDGRIAAEDDAIEDQGLEMIESYLPNSHMTSLYQACLVEGRASDVQRNLKASCGYVRTSGVVGKIKV